MPHCRGAGSNGRGRGRGDARARASGEGFLLEQVGGIQLNEINIRDNETNTHVRNAFIRARARPDFDARLSWVTLCNAIDAQSCLRLLRSDVCTCRAVLSQH